MHPPIACSTLSNVQSACLSWTGRDLLVRDRRRSSSVGDMVTCSGLKPCGNFMPAYRLYCLETRGSVGLSAAVIGHPERLAGRGAEVRPQVMSDRPSSSGTAGPSSTRGGVKLFLGGLSWETTEETVRNHFSRYGEVSEVIVMKDRLTGRPRGFGFMTLADEAAADRVCSDTHVLDGRQLDAKRSIPQEHKPRSKKIFVGGLAPETTEDDFRAYFEGFGRVSEAQIMQDHTSGRSRGFGFVTFEDDSAVDQVFGGGPMHEISGKKVEVKAATPRGSGPQGMGPQPPGPFLRPMPAAGLPSRFSGLQGQLGQQAFLPGGFQQLGYSGMMPYHMPYFNPSFNPMLMQQLHYQYGGFPGFPNPAVPPALMTSAALEQQQQQQQFQRAQQQGQPSLGQQQAQRAAAAQAGLPHHMQQGAPQGPREQHDRDRDRDREGEPEGSSRPPSSGLSRGMHRYDR